MSAPPPLGHLAIAASAGSGKTYQLALRYVALLARGVPADRICALTFARKAAGEITESIVARLCEGAEGARGAARLSEAIGVPGLAPADFVRLLRGFLDLGHRVRVGTLDSFVVGAIRAFPLELGVPPDFALADAESPQAEAVNEAALAAVLRPPAVDSPAQRRFREAFKQATYGREEKGIRRMLAAVLRDCRRALFAAPDAALWGRAETLWPGDPPWWTKAPADPGAAAAAVGAGLSDSGLPAKAVESLLRFAAFAGAYRADAAWDPGSVGGVAVEQLFAAGGELASGAFVLRYGRAEHELPPELVRALGALVGHVVRVEIARAQEQTQGLFRVLDQFDGLYGGAARRAGCLTFEDAQRLLAGAGRLSREPAEPGRLYLDYRLDARLDHWLLDEFQDTGDLQWAAIENLADEIIQDAEGRRTFFYVGDVKQAIYGWRGGNARLFGRLIDRYGDRIGRDTRARSRRSAGPVLEAVNRVFGSLPPGSLPADARAAWAAVWQEHRPEPGAVPPGGYAALLEVPRPERGAPPAADARHEAVAGLLREIDPAARGLETAVLVRTNDAGRAVVDHLRRALPALPVVHEGPADLLDNPVVALLASLLRWAAHPGDTLAGRHLQMSPLAAEFEAAGPPDARALSLLRDVARDGIRGVLLDWGRRLDRAAPLDSFGRGRLQDLVSAAGAFEREGGSGIDAFLDHLATHTVADLAQPGAVRVMTVHQAKGLGFDVVVLPDLQGRSMGQPGGSTVAVHRDLATDRPKWVLAMPRQLVAEADGALAAARAQAAAEQGFDDLCVLYVALTRARRALYLVTEAPAKSATAFPPAALLRAQLAGVERAASWGGAPATCLWEAGEPRWFASLPVAAGPSEPAPPGAPAVASSAGPARLERVQPSEAEHETRAGLLFDPERDDVLDFGTAIHAMFEAVEWADAADAPALARAWAGRADVSAAVRRDAPEQFLRAMAAAEVRAALSRPAAPPELWRERRFEIVLEEGWISGCFDRVTIGRDSAGRATAAEILDYKSNRVSTDEEVRAAAESYRPQMELYRRALSRMLGLAAERIGLHLIFTAPGRVVTLPAKQGT